MIHTVLPFSLPLVPSQVKFIVSLLTLEIVKMYFLDLQNHTNWLGLSKGTNATVFHHLLVSFSIGPAYTYENVCNVVLMDACHCLLGCPWQFDRIAIHDGHANTYSFLFHGKQIVLLPNHISTTRDNITQLLSFFEHTITETRLDFVLLSAAMADESNTTIIVHPLFSHCW